jgi:hypothetical protein
MATHPIYCVLPGKTQGWTSTGVSVDRGDVLYGVASGIVRSTPLGSCRNPDGRDRCGNVEPAMPSHPAPDRIRSSLVFRIGGITVQAGTSFKFVCPATGLIEMTNNGHACWGNSGQWNITLFHDQTVPSEDHPTLEQLQAFSLYRYQPTPAREFKLDPGADAFRFADEQGRSVVFRGVNFGARSKLAPYLPVLPKGWHQGASLGDYGPQQMQEALAEVAPSLDLMKTLGFNVARIPVIWKAMEPELNPNPEQLLAAATHYLELLTVIIDALYRRGIYVFIDFHQDIAHEVFGGDGFPDWTLADDSANPLVEPQGFNNKYWGMNYHAIGRLPQNPWAPHYKGNVARSVRHTLSSFWKNHLTNTRYNLDGFPVQDRLVALIGQVARYFKQMNGGNGHPAIIGYEPFNEPHQAGLPCRLFETTHLPGYYAKVHQEIRRFDRDAFVFIEPRVDWTIYDNLDGPEYQAASFTVAPTTGLGVYRNAGQVGYDSTPSYGTDDRVVFSFHHYDAWVILFHSLGVPGLSAMEQKERQWSGTYDHMVGAATERGLVPFLSEFGGSQEWEGRTQWRPDISHNQVIRAYMELQYRQVEGRALSATYWNYDLYHEAKERDGWNGEDLSLLGPNRSGRHLDIVARPYAMRCQGASAKFYFDVGTKVGAVTFKARQGETAFGSPAVVYVPTAFHYPNSEFIVMTTAEYVRWDPEQQLLYWLPVFVGDTATLVIYPPAGFDAAKLPAELQNQLHFLSFAKNARDLVGDGQPPRSVAAKAFASLSGEAGPCPG